MRSSSRFATAEVTCESVAEILPGIVDGRQVAGDPVQRHVEACLRCQAEVAQYRKLLRALHQLRTEVLEPAPGALAELFAFLNAEGEQRAVRHLLSGRRVAYVGGIAAATAGAAGAAIIVASRARHRRVGLAS